MMTSNGKGKQALRNILLAIVCIALVLAFMVALPQPAQANDLVPPDVPANLQVPAGSKLFLIGHATGTQNYVCLPSSGGGVAFALFTPQATLFDGGDLQTMTHYFGPNPDEGGTIRAAWQFKDASTVWGRVVPGDSYTGSDYVEPGAIAWLKVTIVGYEDGRNGANKLAPTTYIQRVHTSGGVAPSTGCSSTANIGAQAFVPYTTDYYFYR